MRRIWHVFVGHEWQEGCRLCAELRYHTEHEWSPWLYCRCGARLTRADWP